MILAELQPVQASTVLNRAVLLTLALISYSYTLKKAARWNHSDIREYKTVYSANRTMRLSTIIARTVPSL
jgi:16S rRNA C1402 N4-methylase RsmH